ncbi:MurR/RpiR family transcriptional regulator [Siminovitchia sediminis]|uniref:MurR/RpiR family transcriptional regulator n=1 Tax=Siminovitchia sediminis TaxID=1274353 RepID=A0ABW4KI27_9BACI
MTNHKNFLDLLLKARGTLPKKQELLCNFMIENIQAVGVLTIAELAEAANVGTTTVMRLVKNLGYDSYSEVKKELLDKSVGIPKDAWWHLKESFIQKNNEEHILNENFQESKHLLDQTLTPTLLTNFNSAINLLLKANTIHLFGVRSNKALALYLGYLLSEFLPNIRQLSFDNEFIFDAILRFQQGDVLLVIDNSPSTHIGVDAVEFCKENGHPVILVTDHLSSEASSNATITLNTFPSKKQYSVMPTLFIIESLIIELGRQTSDSSVAHLQKLSSILEQKNITKPFTF